MGFKSLQTKYILLVMCCVIASALLIGGVCVHNATETAMREASQNMNLTCESYKYKYDASLRDAEIAVESCAEYASDTLDSVDRFAEDEAYRDEYAQRLEEALRLETLNTDAVMSYYVRFSPDLLSFEKGFRYARASANEPFERIEIVRIQDYQESDDEHVGWYFTPIENGDTTWMEPYYNANFGTYMVSCVKPFYKDGDLVGVIGVDIDFSTLINDLEELRAFDNGYAFLCSSDGKVYYHPLYDSGTYIQEDVEGFDAQLQNESSGDVLYSGRSNGENIEYAFRTLTNGMRLVLRAPVAEINADVANMVRTISAIVLLVVLASVFVTVIVCRHITKPLRELTVAADKISRGEYDIDLGVSSKDEVGVLARTLKVAAVELWANAEYLRQLAYKDSLTSVRNKTAYNLEVEILESRMRVGKVDYGVAVFDVNDLKTANDKYGHEQGDKVIKTGCMRICKTFPHSAVFRVGGDEFVAILQGEDLEHHDELLEEFIRRSEEENAAVSKPQDKVQVAAGIAVFDPETDTCVQDVFNRADALMYEAKQKMKGQTR